MKALVGHQHEDQVVQDEVGAQLAGVLGPPGQLGDRCQRVLTVRGAAYGFTEGHIPGSEIAGTVTAVGDNVDTSWLGRRVWACTGLGGGYAEQAIAPVNEILLLPANLSPADAVTLGSSGVVAHSAFPMPGSLPASQCLYAAPPAASGS